MYIITYTNLGQSNLMFSKLIKSIDTYIYYKLTESGFNT